MHDSTIVFSSFASLFTVLYLCLDLDQKFQDPPPQSDPRLPTPYLPILPVILGPHPSLILIITSYRNLDLVNFFILFL